MIFMKVALVCPYSFAYHGGVQEHVRSLAKVLGNLGHAVKIIGPRQNKKEDYGREIILVGSEIIIPGNDSRVDISYATSTELSGILGKEGFDVVHFHSFQPFLSFQILDFFVKDSRVLKILTSHSNNEGTLLATFFGGVMDFVADSFISKMDGVICVSHAAEKLIKNYPGLKEIVANGVDLARFNPQIESRSQFRGDDKFNLLFVGRLDPRKGVQVLLPAFAFLKKRYENLRLIIVGDGFLKESLLEKVVREKIKDVVFVGSVAREELPSYYRSADVFCAPSLRGESFGLILTEAMACGVAVLTSDIDGYREVVPSKEFLVPPGDSVSLALAIEALVENSGRRKRMVEEGLSRAKLYDWGVVGGKVADFYVKASEAKKAISVMSKENYGRGAPG